MRARSIALLALVALLALFLYSTGSSAETAPRVVSVGGPVTEIVYALGAQQALVGVDTSSLYPEAATRLPQVGYQRQLSAEGLLGLRPTLVLCTRDAGPPAVLEQLRSAGVKVEMIPSDNTVAGAVAKIRAVAQALGVVERANGLEETLKQDLDRVARRVAGTAVRPRVLFLYARGAGTLLVSGRGTAADEMIRLAGGVNPVTAFEGFKPMTTEAVVVAAPDVVFVPERALASVGGPEGLWKLAGLAFTPAGQSRRIVTLEDAFLLGFGPRSGRAVETLFERLHPEQAAPPRHRAP